MIHGNKTFFNFLNEARSAREIEAWAAKRYINRPTIVVTPHGTSFIGSGTPAEQELSRRTGLAQNATYNDLRNVRLGRIQSGGRGPAERIGAFATLPREISSGEQAKQNLSKMDITPSSTADAIAEFPTTQGNPHTQAGEKEAISLYGVKNLLSKAGYKPSQAEKFSEMGSGQFTARRGRRGPDVTLKDPENPSYDIPGIEMKYSSGEQPKPLTRSLDNTKKSKSIVTKLVRSVARNWPGGLPGLLSSDEKDRQRNLDALDAMKASRDRARGRIV